jgi:hypothetical protein
MLCLGFLCLYYFFFINIYVFIFLCLLGCVCVETVDDITRVLLNPLRIEVAVFKKRYVVIRV